MSAHFATTNDDDDDDSFIPDGRISFSNPWYEKTSNKAASSGNSNGSRRDYQKLASQ